MGLYRTLLSIKVEHGFYTRGVCSCLNFLPTMKTQAIFENTGLLLKRTIDGIQIIYHQPRLEALKSYAEDEQEALSFDFKVYSSDKFFRSFSEPYAEIGDQILYFDNSYTNLPGNTLLTLSEYASDADFKKTGAPELDGIIEHRDQLIPPEFVLRIFANNQQGPQLNYWVESTAPAYLIAFKPRQRYWKYYLLGDMARENYFISDQDQQIEFDALGQVSLADQRPAYAFRSKHSIPLHDYYPYRFQLKEKQSAGEKVVIKQLPVASINQIGKEVVVEREVIISEIYINS